MRRIPLSCSLPAFRFVRRYLLVDIEQVYFPVYHRLVHLVSEFPRVSSDSHPVGDFAGIPAHMLGHFFNGHSSFKFHGYFYWLLFCIRIEQAVSIGLNQDESGKNSGNGFYIQRNSSVIKCLNQPFPDVFSLFP